MKRFFTGLESSGKSLMLSRTAEDILQRNARWLKVTGKPRRMAFSMPMAEEFIARVKKAGLLYLEFKNLDEILGLEETDFFFDEIIKFFPASGSASLSNEQLHFITQGEKSGISIYGTSQDFSQVHKQFRRLVQEVYVVTKVVGSRRPMKTAPPIKRIWGVCMLRAVNPKTFTGDDSKMQGESFPSFFLIQKEDCMRYDTSFKVPLTELSTKRVRRQRIEGVEEGKVVYKKEIWV